MESSKCILTFDIEKDMTKALGFGRDLLENHFSNVKRWLEMECCKCGQVWLECFGVRPHGWSSRNFKSIGELWGKVIALDKNRVWFRFKCRKSLG